MPRMRDARVERSVMGPRDNHLAMSIKARALRIVLASRGRTRRATSRPSLRNTSVGHNLTLKERPSGRPLASAILTWRTRGWSENAAVRSDGAARQYPHHGLA